MTIKCRYAFDSYRKVIDIKQLSKKKSNYEKVFRCVACDQILTPVLGEKKQKHFRHKVDANCSAETYLHKLAKLKFYVIYKRCCQEKQPFSITINQKKKCNYYAVDFNYYCNLGEISKTYDLTKYFPKISLEKREGSFIPDLLLSNDKGDKLFIEMAVSHKSSKEKKDSGIRIIEIDIAKESDINVFQKKSLTIKNPNVKFYNLSQDNQSNFCQGKCLKKLIPYDSCIIEHKYFLIADNGRSGILSLPLSQIENLDSTYIHGEFVGDFDRVQRGEVYRKLVFRASASKLPIKNCFLCKHHSESWYRGKSLYCYLYERRHDPNYAADCENYNPN